MTSGATIEVIMDRRTFVSLGAGFGAFAMLSGDEPPLQGALTSGGALKPPKSGPINVAFLVSAGSNVIDMAGPWEVFQDAVAEPGFRLFTVADGTQPVRLTGGLHVIPDYSVESAPRPHVVVVPAMRGTPRVHEWLRTVSATTDLTMSVCTGAFQLARAGLLKGKAATTHHDFWDAFARDFPDVQLKRGLRFVEGAPNIATAGGLTSGVDLALRTVERYFGRSVAQRTAEYMEYGGKGWIT
jgi:transcriptional regulator GlxA family with amidase domain